MRGILSKRFSELADQLSALEATIHAEFNPLMERNEQQLDRDKQLNWQVKVKNLLGQTCGKDSVHLQHFNEAEGGSWSTSLSIAKQQRAIFEAAREDFDGGYLSSVRNMVRAEVFASELEQAEELLQSGYAVPAAVVAGTVLETTLRDLCSKHGIPHGKLDSMNAALAKAGEYSSLEQKQVTAQAAVRNAAAHGDAAKFREQDVEPMIRYVERFVIDHPVV
jgi:hypothetical protein